MKIHVTRSSVAAGDDLDAPHARVFMLPDDSSTEEILNTVIEAGYLARIAGGLATWVVTSQIPIAVIAQQWPGARMLTLPLEARRKASRTEGEMRLHFEYHQQADPEAIYASLQTYPGMR